MITKTNPNDLTRLFFDAADEIVSTRSASPPAALLAPEHAAFLHAQARACLRTERPLEARAWVGNRWWRHTFVPQPDGVDIIVFDETARADREAAHTQLEQLYERLLHRRSPELLILGLIHNINNILTIIGIEAENGVHTGATGGYENILKALERVEHLNQTLTSAYQLQHAAFAPTDLCTVISETLELVAPSLRGTTLRLTSTVRPIAHVRAAHVEQILINLLLNASRAMDNAGTIALSLDERTVHSDDELLDGRYVALTIADTGTGIPPSMAEVLFLPFASTREHYLSGLGLYSARQLAREMDGDLRLGSAAQGASFILLLPAASAR